MSSPAKLRLFVAISVPRAHLEKVRDATGDLRARWSQARWADIANQHVTLKFLGSTPAELDDEVRTAVARVAAERHPAEVRLSGLGVFPSPRRARVLWVGIDDPAGLLTALAGALDEALEPLGFRSEKRPFHAHLTLARFRTPERMGELPDLALDLPPFPIVAVDLFRSHLHPRGARYEILESFSLSGA